MAKKTSNPELDAAIALALDLFEPLGNLHVRKMFGGAGLYCDGRMFVLIADGLIHLKADAVSRPDFEAVGSQPFRYENNKGEVAVMSYWQLPEIALDDSAEALAWGRLGLAAAGRA